jgi:isoquinoline 1-oxidoreductase beta subunit
MRASTDFTRRGFLKSSAALGGGLVVGFFVPTGMRRLLAQEAPAAAAKLPVANAFLRIAPDESVTVFLAHSEMGQGIWTTLPMLVNEELGADWGRIRVEHAPADPAYAHTAYGIQMTGGSTTTWSEFDRYRQVGASTRQLLVSAAARRWGVPESECRVEKGFVIHGDKRLSYGSLADEAARLPEPKTVSLKDPKDWTVIGKPTRRLDTPEKITGKATFGLDVQLPGMLTALVAHAPTFGGKVKSFDAAAAKAVPGVKAVFEIPTGVAVAGESYWSAKLGRDALKVEWEAGPNAGVDSERLLATYRARVAMPGAEAKTAGDVASALAGAGKKVSAEYSVPYLAHAPMESLNCTIRKTSGACEVWMGTQFQTMDQLKVAGVLGLKPEQVAIHTTFLGGGFGRRATPVSDLAMEAANVAKGLDAPVKLMWTREDDMRAGYYRPLAVHAVEGALDAEGKPVAWRHRIATQSILGGTPFAAMIKNGIDETSVEGAADSPYAAAVANHRVELHTMETGVPVLWWRSVGHSHTAFAVESFVDELAHAAGRDPLEFRRALLAKSPRHLAVLDRAAAKAGWARPPEKGRARGLAVHESFGSWVAQVAEVSVEGGRIRVHRVSCAIDCGIAVNPLSIAAQMQSGIAFGLGAALYGALTIREGRVLESNFHDYRVLRMNEMPHVDVEIIESREKSGGAGEPGTPPIAPAVANAVFALTGKRLRSLPLRLS